MTGYVHPLYAESLAEFGDPRELPRSKGWILIREIPHSPFRDATGCYPIFCCSDWSGLDEDLQELEGELVSLSLVADPLGEYDVDSLRRCFGDGMIPFKRHFVVNLGRPLEETVSSHHRYYARKSLRDAAVESCSPPGTCLDEWCSLYQGLVDRHGIRGIKAFSRNSFEKQLSLPGMILFLARRGDEVTGIQQWLVTGDRAYHHLSAYSSTGYRSRISYGLLWSALHHLQELGLRWVDLGGGAGIDDQDGGLVSFKRGWSSGIRIAYFCGKVLDRPVCERLTAETGSVVSGHFPAYRDNHRAHEVGLPEQAK